MIENKQSLRITCRKVRAKIVNSSKQSDLICKRILSLPYFKTAGSILVYYPLEGEVDISPLTSQLQARGFNVFLPFFQRQAIGHYNNVLNYVDKFKGYEPKDPSLIEPNIIIIPALAYDKKGFRLGHGQGWYDRYLKEHKLALRIGVCFTELLLDELPRDANDEKVDIVVSTKKLIFVNANIGN